MRQPKRRSSPLKLLFLVGIIGFLVYVNKIVEPLSPSLFLASPTPTTSPETFITEAETLANAGKYSQALQAYNKAILADPQNPANYIASARLYIYSGEFEKAIENASNAVLLNQTSSMGEALKGFALGLMGQYLNAEGSLNRAIELDPSNASAYAYLSLILSQKIVLGEEVLGDLDRSIEASRKAESIAPDSLESHWSRGVVLEITANYNDAVTELEKAVAINANIAELHIALGRNYRFLGKNDKAVEEYTRANALNPADSYPETLISKVYMNIGEFERAIQYAEQAVADEPEDPYLYGNLGIVYEKNNELDKAVLMLRLAVRGGLTPEGAEVKGLPLAYGNVVQYYSTYGLALMELGYCGEATDIAQSIIQSIENDEIATYNANYILDRCYQKINDLQLLKLPTPTFLPTWTPRPSPTPTRQPTLEPSSTPIP
ncbi:MAG: tetratricopeptide repeat protein [Anaerolineaceae bacterium]|nr:tetratricopeptide repeat protein [Anaerolineaceae bacterium]